MEGAWTLSVSRHHCHGVTISSHPLHVISFQLSKERHKVLITSMNVLIWLHPGNSVGPQVHCLFRDCTQAQPTWDFHLPRFVVLFCRYKEGKYPENMEKLTVLNTSPLEADISFCFLHDSKAETFLLDPPTMLLKPGQKEVRYVFIIVYHLMSYQKINLMTNVSCILNQGSEMSNNSNSFIHHCHTTNGQSDNSIPVIFSELSPVA